MDFIENISFCKKVQLCSDIHLSPKTELLTSSFCKWLEQTCILTDEQDRPEWLLILGDLFDVWLGDDFMKQNSDISPIPQLEETFLKLKNVGIRLGIMHGNRDFLLGNDFYSRFSAKPLDPSVKLKAESENYTLLLMHGDELCTDDKQHQNFREITRNEEWKETFLNKNMEERLKIGSELRELSESAKSEKTLSLMDVNPLEVDKVLTRSGSDGMIHGHTHLPGKYLLPSGKYRWVIQDWRNVSNSVVGGGLEVTREKISTLFFRE